MKVEFLESDIYGAELSVVASEFLKAEKSDVEFQSLVHATDAFARSLGGDYQISKDEYEAVVGFLDKNGVVIFVVKEDKYPTRRWCEIYVSNNNHPQKILYEDEDGYHLKRRGKYNPKSVATIRKRYEAEDNSNE